MWQDAAPSRALQKGRNGFTVKHMAKQNHIPSARQVRAIRAYLGLTQPQFAADCSISDSALYDFEKGRRQTSPGVREAIAAHVAALKFKVQGNAIILPE